MTDDYLLSKLREETRKEVLFNILPYWSSSGLDDVNGGFIGRADSQNNKIWDAGKGAILNTRILWSFSACYKRFKDEAYLSLAQRAYDYLTEYFLDAEHGGVYWMLDANGKPLDDRKHVYAQSFAIYALSEFYGATGDHKALGTARELFDLIETQCADHELRGYLEGFDRIWKPAEDGRLSDLDRYAPKSTNSHLHILEAYTNLYRYSPGSFLASRLSNLCHLFLDKMIMPDQPFMTEFFERDWTRLSRDISYGHDIEAVWLLIDAAEVLGDNALLDSLLDRLIPIAWSVLQTGIDADGGVTNRGTLEQINDYQKHWWQQAEAMVGFLAAYRFTEESVFLQAANKVWDFIKTYIVDQKYGGWRETVQRDGRPVPADKIRSWKGPYHNSRAMLEVIARVEELMGDGNGMAISEGKPEPQKG